MLAGGRRHWVGSKGLHFTVCWQVQLLRQLGTSCNVTSGKLCTGISYGNQEQLTDCVKAIQNFKFLSCSEYSLYSTRKDSQAAETATVTGCSRGPQRLQGIVNSCYGRPPASATPAVHTVWLPTWEPNLCVSSTSQCDRTTLQCDRPKGSAAITALDNHGVVLESGLLG